MEIEEAIPQGKPTTWERRLRECPGLGEAGRVYAELYPPRGRWPTLVQALLGTTTPFGAPVPRVAAWMREEAEARLHLALRRVSRLLDALILRLGDRGGVSLSLTREGYARALGATVPGLPQARQFENRALGLVEPESEEELRKAVNDAEVDFFGVALPLYRVDLIAEHLRFLGAARELWFVPSGALPAGYVLGRRETRPGRRVWLCDEICTPGVSPAAIQLQSRAGDAVLRQDAMTWLWERVWRPALADAASGGRWVTGWAQTLRRHVCRLGLGLAAPASLDAGAFFAETIAAVGWAAAAEPDEVLPSLDDVVEGRVLGATRILGERVPEACHLAAAVCALRRRMGMLLQFNDAADRRQAHFRLLFDFCNRWQDDGPVDLSLLPVAFAIAPDGTLDRTRLFQAACVLARAAVAEAGTLAETTERAIRRGRVRDSAGADITSATWEACRVRSRAVLDIPGGPAVPLPDEAVETRILTALQLGVLKGRSAGGNSLAGMEADFAAWAGGLDTRLLDSLGVASQTVRNCRVYIRGRLERIDWGGCSL